MITYTQAEDELFTAINLAYNAACVPLKITPKIVWPGEAVPAPDAGIIYAQPMLEVVTRTQVTLRRINNKSVFESACLFTLQVFAPQSLADGRANAILLAQAVCQTVSKASASGELWYRNAKAGPVAGTAGMNQVNVVSTVVFQSEE